MANLNLNIDELSTLNCAISSDEYKHLCRDPVALSCSHNVCKSCIPFETSDTNIKCLICNEINSRNLNEDKPSSTFESLLNENLKTLFTVTNETFSSAIRTCNEIVNNGDERIDRHIEFIKDEIQVHIESIKLELDNLYEKFACELEEIKQKWKIESKNVKSGLIKFDETTYKNDLKHLEENINKQENLTKDTLYHYQNQMRKVQNIIKEYNSRARKLQFIENNYKIEKDLIGKLVFEIDTDESILRRIKSDRYERKDVGCKPYDLCVLPNGNLLLVNHRKYNLVLYDEHFELLKTIEYINNKQCGSIAVTTDGSQHVFLSDYLNSRIIKTDLEMNEVAVFGDSPGLGRNQVACPYGLCYYSQNIFICDYNNKRIKKLDSDLNYKTVYQVDYYPWYIKNINNLAMVRPASEPTIYFYDLNDDFHLVKTYKGHNGLIGVSQFNFYEYYPPNNTFYCYNRQGLLSEVIITNGLNLPIGNSNGSICIFHSKMCFANNSNSLIVI